MFEGLSFLYIKCYGQVVNTLGSYFGGAGLKFLPETNFYS
jgi:hypothetical protein